MLEKMRPSSGHHVTSLMVNDLVIAAARQDRATAGAILTVGLEVFAWSSALLTRQAEGEAAAGNRTAVVASYRAALEADPFNQVAAVQVRRLEIP